MTDDIDDPFLTIDEAAQLLRVSCRTLHRHGFGSATLHFGATTTCHATKAHPARVVRHARASLARRLYWRSRDTRRMGRSISTNRTSNRRRPRVWTGGAGHDLVTDDAATPSPARPALAGWELIAAQEHAAR